MKITWTLGAAAIIAAIGAVPLSWAQTNESSDSGGQTGQQDSTHSTSMTGRGMGSRGMMHGGMMGDRGESYHHMGMGEQGAHQGAVFRFRHGDERIDIRCPKDEDLSTCVQGAIRLIREIKTMQQGTPGLTAPSSNPSGTVIPNSPTSPQGQ